MFFFFLSFGTTLVGEMRRVKRVSNYWSPFSTEKTENISLLKDF